MVLKYFLFSLLFSTCLVLNAQDCTQDPKAQRAKNNMSGDGSLMCGNAAQFYAYLCACKDKPRTAEQAKMLKATLEKIKSTYNDYGSYCDGIGRITESIPNCKVGKAGAGGVVEEKPLFERSFEEIITGDELSNALTDFLSQLSAAGAGPGVQALAQEMRQNQQKIDQIRRDTEAVFGSLDQSSIQMLNMAENVMQAVSIGKAIFGKQKEPSLEETLSPSQQQVREIMGELSRKLRMVYDEVIVIPNYPVYDKETLKDLEKIENRFNAYNVTTSQARMKFIWFMDHDGYPTVEQYQQASNRIDQMNSQELIQVIATIQKRYNMNNVNHIANKEEAFKATQTKIDFYKARCYENMGDRKRAQELRSNLNYNVALNDAIKLSLESYDQKDFYSTIRYTDVVQDHFSNEKTLYTLYPNISNLNHSFDGIYRYEINYLMALGVISYISSNQLSQAEEALKGLRRFHKTFDLTYQEHLKLSARKKANGYTDEEFKQENLRSEMVLLAAEAYVSYVSGDINNATNMINRAIELNKESPCPMGFTNLEPWLHYIKVEILVKANKFSEAKASLRDVKMMMRTNYTATFDVVNKEDIDFLGAYIRFKNKDYNGALLAIRIAKQKNAKSPRIYALEEQVLLAKGDTEGAKNSRKEYANLLK